MSARLGLFGGSFNPIHHGHLIAVQEAFQRLDLKTVIFVPTHNPPHKAAPEVSTHHRLFMTELATTENKHFTVSGIELQREGPSYTITTLRSFKHQHPDDKLCLLIGADELAQFQEWKDWNKLLEEFTVVGLKRPGFDRDSITETVLERSQFIQIPEVQISSSMIRERFRNNTPVRYFLPGAVWNYIREHKLYSE